MRSPWKPSMAGAANGRGSRDIRRAGYQPSGRAARWSVAADEADETTLHLHPVGPEDAGLVRLVRRLQGDRGAAAAQPLQGGFDVAVENAGVLHAVAGNFERIVLAAAEQARGDADSGFLVAQRRDRRAGGDPP